MTVQHCRQRQKFGSFDYCGKACRNASKGNPAGGSNNNSGTSGGGGGIGSMIYQAISHVTGGATAPPVVNTPSRQRRAPAISSESAALYDNH